MTAMMIAEALMAPHFNQHFSPRPLHTESEAVAAFYEQWGEDPDPGSLELWRKDAESLEPWLKEVPDAGSLESRRKEMQREGIFRELQGERVGNEWVLHLHRGGHHPMVVHLDSATGRVKEVIVTNY
jgi:hypothetical protein